MSDWACISRFGGIGDNLVASAVLPALKKRYGCVEVISQLPQSCVFENNPHIDKLSQHKEGDIPGESAEAWHRWHKVRASEYAFYANLSHSMETMVALFPTQTQFWWPAAWRRKFCGRNYIEMVADVCGVPYGDCAPGFFPTAEEDAQAQQTRGEQIGNGRVIGWVLSGSRVDKIHPASTLIVARLIRECDATVILFGGPGRDCEMGNRIIDHVRRQNGSTKGVVGAADATLENQKWPIRRVLTQLRHCDLVIGPDTGPMWSVAMHPVPKIMTLSHASLQNITHGWRNCVTLHADPAKVPCWPCHQLHSALDTCTPDETKAAAACISSISVEAVVAAAHEALGRKADVVDLHARTQDNAPARAAGS